MTHTHTHILFNDKIKLLKFVKVQLQYAWLSVKVGRLYFFHFDYLDMSENPPKARGKIFSPIFKFFFFLPNCAC